MKLYAMVKRDDGWWVISPDGHQYGPFATRAEAAEYIIKLIEEEAHHDAD